jgi:transposase-like protein
MKGSIRLINKHRSYSREFKESIVKEYESGKLSVPQLGRLHNLSSTIIYRWIYKFSTFNEKGFRVIEMKESSDQKVKQLEQKIKELEQIVGRKQIMIDYLEKMMEIAKEELDIDVKKNFDTRQSIGSGTTKKK